MNPLDQNTQGLNGIGRDLKKFGRSIDSHVRSVNDNVTKFCRGISQNFHRKVNFLPPRSICKLSAAGKYRLGLKINTN